jgi:predicted dinucleotide-binding enzyme
MNITVIGRGNVGGGLAGLWREAGHEVQELGQEGGDASGADVVLLAVPSAAIADALGKVDGLDGKVVVDATNHSQGERPAGFESNAEQVKSITGGPVAKAFNLNFARLYDRVREQERPPGNLYCADDGAREAVEELIRSAGYQPVSVGGLENARALEDGLKILFGVSQAGSGPVFYRFTPPGEL